MKLQRGTQPLPHWRGGAKCLYVQFPSLFPRAPKVHAAVEHRGDVPDKLGPRAPRLLSWVETVDMAGFRACVRDTTRDETQHGRDLVLQWLAAA